MRVRSDHQLQASILDRLIDDEPDNQLSTSRGMAINLKTLRASVRRDLEALLNARIHWHTWPRQYEELATSVLTYGLPGFSNMPVSSTEGRELLCQKVRDTILRFEPRFIEVEVSCLEDDLPLDRIMRLRINALLWAEPEPELISFDSEVEPINLGMTVQETSL